VGNLEAGLAPGNPDRASSALGGGSWGRIRRGIHPAERDRFSAKTLASPRDVGDGVVALARKDHSISTPIFGGTSLARFGQLGSQSLMAVVLDSSSHSDWTVS
jgi:hypothetical protein